MKQQSKCFLSEKFLKMYILGCLPSILSNHLIWNFEWEEAVFFIDKANLQMHLSIPLRLNFLLKLLINRQLFVLMMKWERYAMTLFKLIFMTVWDCIYRVLVLVLVWISMLMRKIVMSSMGKKQECPQWFVPKSCQIVLNFPENIHCINWCF